MQPNPSLPSQGALRADRIARRGPWQLWGAWALLLTLAGCGPETPTPPDVVLIELDSVRADHVEHLGYPLPTSRALDGFRQRATLFGAARSPSSASVPATAALLTGVLPSRLDLAGQGRIGLDAPTLAEQLRQAGWTTLGVSHHPDVDANAGFGRGFDQFSSPLGDPEEHPDGAVMVDWLREWLAREPPQPVFLYLLPLDAHPPYRVPADRQSALLGRPPSDALPYDGALMRAARQPLRRRARASIGEVQVQSLTEQYDTAVRYAFDRVGQILDMLDQAGRLDGALVVIVSNHGQELFEHGGFDHGRTLYEEVLRVPLYVKPPGGARVPRIDEPVSTLDVVPTLLELLGLPAVPGDGRSLAPLLRGEVDERPPRDFFHSLLPEDAFARQRALLRGRHKLVEGIGRSELYDLTLDPGEHVDRSKTDREIVLELRSALDAAVPFDASERGR